MATFFTDSSSIFFTIGLTIIVLAVSQHWSPIPILLGAILALLGIVFWIRGYNEMREEKKKMQEEEREKRDEKENQTAIQCELAKTLGAFSLIAQHSSQGEEEILQLLRGISNNIKSKADIKNEHKP